jgi:hypothetical protein
MERTLLFRKIEVHFFFTFIADKTRHWKINKGEKNSRPCGQRDLVLHPILPHLGGKREVRVHVLPCRTKLLNVACLPQALDVLQQQMQNIRSK